MPEGDTIFRTARTLATVLGGKRVVRFASVLAHIAAAAEEHAIEGRTVSGVTAAGKHLLIDFSGVVLRTHLRMNGSWHVYRPGEKWMRARRDMRIVIAVADFEAVGFSIPVAEMIEAERLGSNRELSRLGPDLLGEFDTAEALARLSARGGSIAEALLDQRVAAGAGNVYKSEILFLEGIDPARPVGSLSREQLERVLQRARALLEVNVTASADPRSLGRRTRSSLDPAGRLWVYGRRGKPCFRCGTPIVLTRFGENARTTFFCPHCQS
jgi:endonuclease VIII